MDYEWTNYEFGMERPPLTAALDMQSFSEKEQQCSFDIDLRRVNKQAETLILNCRIDGEAYASAAAFSLARRRSRTVDQCSSGIADSATARRMTPRRCCDASIR